LLQGMHHRHAIKPAVLRTVEDALDLARTWGRAPGAYSLNTLQGRSALIRYLTGGNSTARSESFGAKLLSIQEVL